jgi:hypothetical protein
LLPQTEVRDCAVQGWRPFGHAEDLDVDFNAADRPALVTKLLARCGAPRDDRYWWSQAVGARIAALVRLLAVTDGIEQLGLQARCREPACGAWFEFELPLASVLDQLPPDEPIRATLTGSRPVTLRRPSGRDLSEWRAQRPRSHEQAVQAMLQSLVIDGAVSVEDAPALADILAAEDPLVAFSVSCTCPVCDGPTEVRIDLEDIALTRLRQQQRALLREIHILASHYGWTEAQIMAVAPARRARYLSLIEDGS